MSWERKIRIEQDRVVAWGSVDGEFPEVGQRRRGHIPRGEGDRHAAEVKLDEAGWKRSAVAIETVASEGCQR